MGIQVKAKTKSPATLKLYNHISSYLFEQDYDELKGKDRVKEILGKCKEQLAEIIKNG